MSAKTFLQTTEGNSIPVLPGQRDRTSLAVVARVHGNSAYGPAWNQRTYCRTAPGPSDPSLDGVITKQPLSVPRQWRRSVRRAKTADMWMRSPGVAFSFSRQRPSIGNQWDGSRSSGSRIRFALLRTGCLIRTSRWINGQLQLWSPGFPVTSAIEASPPSPRFHLLNPTYLRCRKPPMIVKLFVHLMPKISNIWKLQQIKDCKLLLLQIILFNKKLYFSK